ncbi:hypothetical protein HY732_02630 [Candidatus Uhrbacteria bacterium]|nr:hypothetical protein [Candidatus Uhrbacteria bacterium]
MITCRQCQSQFFITDTDRAFYSRFDVPLPALCPDCRQQRRLLWRNERKMYQRKCDMCKKDMIALYSADKPYVVYCSDCWWSDRWDPLSYGMAPDYSRSFFDQFQELQLQVPRLAMHGLNNTNSDYCPQSTQNKNCYLMSGSDYNEDCFYATNIQRNKNCFDAMFIFDCELCYECIDVNKSYGCSYMQNCEGCTDSLFLFDCKSSTNCALSVNLRGGSYVYKNKQETKESYEKKLNELRDRLRADPDAVRREFETLKAQNPARFAFVVGCEQSTGEYLNHCRQASHCFDGEQLDSCAHMYCAMDVKDSYDVTCIGFRSELLYEGMAGVELNTVAFFNMMGYSSWCDYCALVFNSTHCFGCVGMKKNKQCILNKQYSAEEYDHERKKIIAHMKSTGEWGEFFPMRLSPFAYNETPAQEYFPITKEQAELLGARWQETSAGVFGKETLSWENVSSDPGQAPDTLSNEIVACISCGKNYKIIKQALKFYKKQGLSIPRKCPDCRHLERLILRNPRKLWTRQCMCEGVRVNEYIHAVPHAHGETPCTNHFATAYAPDRNVIMYCQECYTKEVI